MTLRNRRRSLALWCALGMVVLAAPPVDAAPFCRGQRATIVGTRGIDFLAGTPGPDVIVGWTGLDQIYGRGGDDTICGGRGDDFLIGGPGHDIALGQQGSDEIFGQHGHDYLDSGPGRTGGLAGGPGGDHLIGGAGFDTANFVDSGAGVVVDLGAGTAEGEGGDTLSEIDGIFGSDLDDILVGNTGDNVLVGGGGADSLTAGGNGGALGPTPSTTGVDILVGDGDPSRPPADDELNGGPGVTVADYSSANTGVQVDLDAGTAAGNGLDRLAEIQIVAGSRFDDTLLGNDEDNAFRGSAGNDSIDGRGGTDTAVFTTASQGITADLRSGLAAGEGSDSLESIESLWGGRGDDHLVGDDDTNALAGLGGSDRLAGNEGDDLLAGGVGFDSLDGGDGTDDCSEGEANVGCESESGAMRAETVSSSRLLRGLYPFQRSDRRAWIRRAPELPRL